MKRVLTAVLVLAFSPLPPASAAQDEASCKAIFDRSDIDNDKWLRGAEAAGFLSAMERAGIQRANSDSKLSEGEFMRACEKGTFGN